MQQRASVLMRAVRAWWATSRVWAHPTFWVGVALCLLVLIPVFAAFGPFVGLLMLALIVFPTALYVAATRRGSWLQLPRKRMVGVAGMVASVALLVVAGVGTSVTSDAAVSAASQVGPYDAPAAATHSHAAPGAKASRTPTSAPAREATATSTPHPAPASDADPASKSSGDLTALAMLAELPTRPAESMAAYDRVLDFGSSWLDVDNNGCDTRNDVLRRDLTVLTTSGSCIVLTGTLSDPYTGTRIDFVRGVRTSAAVQIDHVVALADAWRTGAQHLSAAQRVDLANDPLNLLAVDGPTNESKGDGDAAEWLPANTAYRCPYAARQVSVKKAYGLWVTSAERAALQRVLSNCSDQLAIASTPVTDAAARDQAAAAAAPVAAPPAPAPAPAPAPVVPAPPAPAVPAPAPAPGVYYANCTAVRAAGAAPITVGQPGYSRKLDRDGDGVGCE